MKKAVIVLIISTLFCALWAEGPTIVDEWSAVRAPPAPTLMAPGFDPSTTALLLLDFQDRIVQGRPRAAATVPRVARLLDFARSSGILVAYSLAGQSGPSPRAPSSARASAPVCAVSRSSFRWTEPPPPSPTPSSTLPGTFSTRRRCGEM